MTDQRTRVDVLSLEDFKGTLTARLAEIDQVLTTLNTKLACRPPALGTFADATKCSTTYMSRQMEAEQRARRLKTALEAAREATERIITNYETAEARNHANARDIADALSGVGEALTENGRADV